MMNCIIVHRHSPNFVILYLFDKFLNFGRACIWLLEVRAFLILFSQHGAIIFSEFLQTRIISSTSMKWITALQNQSFSHAGRKFDADIDAEVQHGKRLKRYREFGFVNCVDPTLLPFSNNPQHLFKILV